MKPNHTIAVAVLVMASIILLEIRASNGAGSQEVDKNSDEKTLIEIEHRWANAYVSADAENLASILSPDYVQTNTRGKVTDKNEELSELRKGSFRYEKFETTEMKVQLYGDAAVVTGLITGKGTDKASGKTIEGHMRMTDTFIRQDGRWQVVASQTTLVPDGITKE